MPRLSANLILPRCPHCAVARPNLDEVAATQTSDYRGGFERHWRFYQCSTCGGVVTAWAHFDETEVMAIFPTVQSVNPDIPEKAADYLSQAMESVHAPAGAIMLCASAVDAMLKQKGYKEGSLYSRIDKSATDHVITKDMAKWAHHVRLEANDERHADEQSKMPTTAEAEKCIDFTKALGEILYVLPKRVSRGLTQK